jgi:hypothetical protein
MRPAHEGFHPDDPARGEIDLGLEVQDHLAALMRTAQFFGQIQIQHCAHDSAFDAPVPQPAKASDLWASFRHLSVRGSRDELFSDIGLR